MANPSRKTSNKKNKKSAIDPFWGTVITGIFTIIAAIIAAFATINSADAKGSQASPALRPPPRPSAAASNQPPYREYRQISFTGGGTTWYLDVNEGQSSPGTRILPWPNDPSSEGKKWYFYPVPSSIQNANYYVITNSLSQIQNSGPEGTMVLDYNPKTKSLTLEKYRPDDADQEWATDDGGGGKMLHNAAAGGACLFHNTASGTTGMTIGVQPTCNGTSSYWSIPSSP